MTTQVLLLYKMFRTFYLQQCLPLLQQGQMPHSFPRTFLAHFLRSIWRILDLLFKTPSLNVSYLMHFSVLLYCNKEDWNGHRIIGFMPLLLLVSCGVLLYEQLYWHHWSWSEPYTTQCLNRHAWNIIFFTTMVGHKLTGKDFKSQVFRHLVGLAINSAWDH